MPGTLRIIGSALLLACMAAPAWGMAQRPQEAPVLSEAHPAASIADLEEAAGHVLILGPEITFETSKGNFTLVTFPKEAPRTVEQILKLVQSGFYENIQVHRAIHDFAVQMGDPASKKLAANSPKIGNGGSGKTLPPEFEGQTVKHLLGTVALARKVKDPNSGDSQFYVTLGPTPHLDGAFTIWGHVISGMDVIRSLDVGDRILHVAIVTPKPNAR